MHALADNAESTAGLARPDLSRRPPAAGVPAKPADPQSAAPRRPPQRRVLLVDDEPGIIAALRRLVRREGYELVSANSGPEAIKRLEAQPVQLIISDHRMPGMIGIELLQQVRERWPDTVRIILSGYSEVNTIIAAVNEGKIYKFLTKPWNDEELKLHIRRALEQHELEEENRRMAREIAAQNDRLRELNLLLEQRAADASTGLASTQTLLEAMGVGVLAIDQTGLVVGANRRASDIISSGKAELIGIPIERALPHALRDFVRTAGRPEGDADSRRMELEGRKLQCRLAPVVAEGTYRGNVVALWEEVA
jgi:CheY-like chemotaxis protein